MVCRPSSEAFALLSPPFLVLEKAISSTSYEIDIGGAFFYIYFQGLDLPMLLVSPTTQSHGQASD